MKTVIIADDLTGACDTAVKMCSTGRPCRVYLDNPIEEIEEPGAAVNTDSRSLSNTAAFTKVSAIADSLKTIEDIQVYKKIDSLFRGNVMTETDALMRTLGYQSALICAAVPGNSRAVRGGKLIAPNSVYHGMDIIRTAFRGSEQMCVSIPLEKIRQGHQALVCEISKALSDGKRFLIADAETEADLSVTADAVLQFKKEILPAGAAGFIVPLLDPHGQSGRTNAAFTQSFSTTKRARFSDQAKAPLLCVLGTNHPVTAEQVRYLCSRETIPVIAIPPSEILNENPAQVRDRYIEMAGSLLQTNPDMLLLTVAETVLEKPESAPARPDVENNAYAECCTDIAAALVNACVFRGMAVSGGTTAQSLLKKMSVRSIRVLTEFAPGVPVALIDDTKNGSLLIATKSGGYGEPEILYNLKRFL